MVTLISEQQSDETFEETYSRLLLGPSSSVSPDKNSNEQFSPPVPLDANIDPQENNKPRLQAHKSCELWLTNLIRLLDTGRSPHIIIYNNLKRIQDDLVRYIQPHLLNSSVDTLFGNRLTVRQNFTQAKVRLASATETRKALPGKPTLEQRRGKKVSYYDFLMECIEWFEKVLQLWNREDLSANEGEPGSDPRIKAILNEQRKKFDTISEYFRTTSWNDIEPPSVIGYEAALRAIIARLSHGSNPTILAPEISDKQANYSIHSKGVLIQDLRKTKKLFNLVLDEFVLCEREGESKEAMLFTYFGQCEDAFLDVEQSWAEKLRSN